jgi:AcrR family transcriptional regulator
MGSLERREREKEERRGQILDAARDVLLQKGLSGTTMAAIARLAELSVGSLYVYFRSKEEVFAALQEEGLAILDGMIRNAAAGGASTEERLTNIAGAYLEFCIGRSDYFDIINYFLTSPSVVFPDHLKARIDDIGGRVLGVVSDVIARGAGEGDIHHPAPHECAIAFWGLLHGLLQFRKLRDTMLGIEDFRGLYMRAARDFVEGLRSRN